MEPEIPVRALRSRARRAGGRGGWPVRRRPGAPAVQHRAHPHGPGCPAGAQGAAGRCRAADRADALGPGAFLGEGHLGGQPDVQRPGGVAADKAAFRTALAKRRCLIPASGYYEWKALGQADPAGGRKGRAKVVKQPYYMTPEDGSVMAFAGLWEYWRPAGG